MTARPVAKQRARPHRRTDRQNLINEVSQLEHQHGRLIREQNLYAEKLAQAESQLGDVQEKLRHHYCRLSQGLKKT